MKDRRFGAFSLSHDTIARLPDAARLIMGRCIITDCIIDEDGIRYEAWSPDFDALEGIGLYPPKYAPTVTDGRVEWIKLA